MSKHPQSRYDAARAEWLSAKSRQADDLLNSLPPALRADLQALRDAGLTFTINPSTPTPGTKSVRIELLTRQPTIRRANTSMTKATYSQPCQVET